MIRGVHTMFYTSQPELLRGHAPVVDLLGQPRLKVQGLEHVRRSPAASRRPRPRSSVACVPLLACR